MIRGSLVASLLGNLFRSKGVKPNISGRELIKAGERTIRAGQDF